jgi:hypothetical protein
MEIDDISPNDWPMDTFENEDGEPLSAEDFGGVPGAVGDHANNKRD